MHRTCLLSKSYAFYNDCNQDKYLLPVILLLFLLSWIIEKGFAIKCYQCSTEKDGKGVDNCGAYKAFNYSQHIAVDCMGEEAVTPGTFCFKSIQQGPRGFIWDGRWRSVIRRCAQVSERGISWSCDWGYHENGVYWEECYCAEDGCNRSINIPPSLLFNSLILMLMISFYYAIGF
uniref:Protein sleepless n=1 Tax=Sarcoptes scabiei TaxID=52283 RepID=A0A834R3B7_SARSC